MIAYILRILSGDIEVEVSPDYFRFIIKGRKLSLEPLSTYQTTAGRVFLGLAMIPCLLNQISELISLRRKCSVMILLTKPNVWALFSGTASESRWAAE